MEKFIIDERSGLKYELVGDYYLIAGEDEPEGKPIGIWGQRRLRYIDYLAELDESAEAMFSRLVKELAEKESVTETLKAQDQMAWVQAMNNIRNRAAEVVYNDLIYN